MYVDTQQPSQTTDPLSLDSLIAWLEKQPAKKGYDYGCVGECLLAQWAKNIDPKSTPISRYAYTYVINGAAYDLVCFHVIASGRWCNPMNWTYGKALKRALAERG